MPAPPPQLPRPRPPRGRWARRAAGLSAAVAVLGAVAAPDASAALVGSATSYRLSTVANPVLDRSEVVRWDPCSTIGYRINAALGGRQALADVKTAVARLSASSGLSFRYLGTTTYVPTAGRAPLPGSPLVVAWAARTASSHLGAGEVGHGGWRATATATGHYRVSSGYVVVRAGAPLAMGFGAGVTRGRVLLHELGHAVGLDHVSDRTMVMNTTVSTSSPVATYQAGDLSGLSRVGRAAGCVA
ncbi:MAG: putative cell wall binding repeat 2-containing protein [Frankiales bacterium]|nr:putative cell wall binding repeat 2-containing protein [Frankiales bacterium]